MKPNFRGDEYPDQTFPRLLHPTKHFPDFCDCTVDNDEPCDDSDEDETRIKVIDYDPT